MIIENINKNLLSFLFQFFTKLVKYIMHFSFAKIFIKLK